MLLRDLLRRLECELLLVQLVGNDKILKVQHRHAAAERLDAEAGDQLRRRLGDGNDFPSVVLLELLENAADKRRLACRRSAGQDDTRDLFCQKDRSFASFYSIILTSSDSKCKRQAQPLPDGSGCIIYPSNWLW